MPTKLPDGDYELNNQQPLAAADANAAQPGDNLKTEQPDLQAGPNASGFGFGGFPPSSAQIQAHQQMVLMQMMQMNQQAMASCGGGGQTQQQQGLAQLMNLQQQQMNLLQSMSMNGAVGQSNPMAPNMMMANPSQQPMMLLPGPFGGNMMGVVSANAPTFAPIPNNIMSPAVGFATSPSRGDGVDTASAADNSPEEADDDNMPEPGWEDQYKALQRYRLVNGHTKVPARYKENPKLGRWVMTQRRQMALMQQAYPNALTAERIAKLDEIGFTWSVRPEPYHAWNKKMEELKEYKKKFGNTMVPQRYQKNPQLGTWVHTQRRQYKLLSDGKKSSMTQKKIDSLNEIGFVWVARHLDDNDGDDDDDDSIEKEFNERAPSEGGEIDLAENLKTEGVKHYLMTGGEHDDLKNEDAEDDKNVDVMAQV